MKDNERNPKNIQREWGIAHFQQSSPLTQLSHLHLNSIQVLSVPKSHCTEHPNLTKWCFPLCLLQYNCTSPWYRYISFIDLTYNHNWSHVVIEEHSDVPVCQTYRAISQILYIQSIIGVLYSTVTYVWAQDITWDWMWCSSYRRKKSLIVIVHFVIFISYDFFKIFIILFCYFLCLFLIYLFGISSNYNQ